jgi:hypothetical protein
MVQPGSNMARPCPFVIPGKGNLDGGNVIQVHIQYEIIHFFPKLVSHYGTPMFLFKTSCGVKISLNDKVLGEVSFSLI